MDGLEIAHRRLRQQFLTGEPAADPVALVRHLGAVQAQEFAVAKWSVGQRTHGYDDEAVQRAIDDGAILRTHVLRPTWHFVAADDLGWICAVTGPRVRAVSAYYYRLHGLTDEVLARTNAVFVERLSGGNHLTRTELAAALADAGPADAGPAGAALAATGNRLAYIVMHAESVGLIASGPMRGRQHTYALVSERVRHPVALDPDAALAELTRRYFTSHGPATVKDFAWWSSLTVTQIRRGLALVGPALSHEDVGGRTYWFAPADPPVRQRSPGVHVLQGYDEFVVAYTESRDVANLRGHAVGPPGENVLVHAIVLDSQLVGHWRRVVERDGIRVVPTLGVSLTARQRRAVELAFARYGTFAGCSVAIDW